MRVAIMLIGFAVAAARGRQGAMLAAVVIERCANDELTPVSRPAELDREPYFMVLEKHGS